MQPGDIVAHYNINQKNGLRQYSSDVKVIKQVGTVANLWEAQILTGQHTGKILKLWLFDEDIIARKFSVIEGGKHDS